MGELKHLHQQEAIDKIIEITKDQMCLFCTQEDGKVVSRPMSTAGVDEDGSIWFLSRKESEKNEQIKEDDTTYLMYMDTGKQHYLALTGRSEIVVDRKKVDELWSVFAKAWFEKGKDDPALTLIRFTPEEGHYWDTKNGKLVSLLKIAVAAVTGNSGNDGGVDGDLKLKTSSR